MKFDIYTVHYGAPGKLRTYKTVDNIKSAMRIGYAIVDDRDVSEVAICVDNWIVGSVKKEKDYSVPNGKTKKFFYNGYLNNKRFLGHVYNKYELKGDGTLGKGVGKPIR